MKPFISVIMPVYNCEKYVGRVIESILAQTFQNWELIVIDDCSTDKTADVLGKWAEKDSRISLILQEKNSGPGRAKNLGIDRAAGTYITFCDADDWIESDAFESMSDRGTEDSDVIVAGYYRDICDEKGNVIERNLVAMPAFKADQKKEVISDIVRLDQYRLFSYAWNKLYKSSILKKKNIRFSDKKFGEDYDFNISFFEFAGNIRMLEKGFYHYIKQNEESLTEKFIPDFYEINRERFEKMCSLMKKYDCYTMIVCQVIMNLYIKHVLSATARLFDKRGRVTRKNRRVKVKEMLRDSLSLEALKYSRGNSKSEKICNAVFMTRSVSIILLFGRVLWLMQTRGKKIYEKVK